MRISRFITLVTAAGLLFVTGCEKKDTTADLAVTGSMELRYAEQFSVDYCENGCSVVDINGDKFLIVPEDVSVPEDTAGMTVIKQPIENIYVAATSAMDLFDGIGRLSLVTMTSTNADSWSLPAVRDAVKSGDIEYIGKYSSPDYETLVAENCGLALESTMIYHTPKVKEQIESFGIPVMTERSSYETHPLGRMEWMKLYGLITGDYDSAEKLFNEKIKSFEELSVPDIPDSERRTAAFFYVTSNGYISIRKPADYVAKMIDLAGGKYIFSADDLNVDDNALSTMNIQTETFYELAHDADILIYNSTIDGEIYSTEQLIEKCSVLADFRAVKEGNVWCTGQNMFQQTTGAADMICDLNSIFTDKAGSRELTYLHKLD